MIKKIIPIISSISILCLCIFLPYVLMNYDEKLILNKENISDVQLNKNLKTVKDKLTFIKDSNYKYSTNLLYIDGLDTNLNEKQITSIYNELNKIEDLNKYLKITVDDLSSYKQCQIKTISDSENSLSLIQLTILKANDGNKYYADIWFDSSDYTIYQIRCESFQTAIFAQLDLVRIFSDYLGISENDFVQLYNLDLTEFSLYILLENNYSTSSYRK